MLPTYCVSANRSAKSTSRSLIDRGANGGIAGDSVHVIAETERRVNVQGVGNHELSDLKIVTAGGMCPFYRGDVLVILHQYALIPGSQTIHSSTQMEQFGLCVDDHAVAHGGTQTITTHDDYTLLVDFVNGLPYLPMQPFTNNKWDTLPHICLTSDAEWSTDTLDHVISDSDDWYNPPSNAHHSVSASCHLITAPIQGELAIHTRCTMPSNHDFDKYQDHFLGVPVGTIGCTFDASTQYARSGWIIGHIYDTHKSPFPALNMVC